MVILVPAAVLSLRMKSQPWHRFTEFVPLDGAELDTVHALATGTRHFRRHDIIREQGEPAREIYLLTHGWVGSCIDVANGSRQMTKVHLPGDLLGTPSMVLSTAADTLLALTNATVEIVPMTAFARLFMSSPRFAAAMFLSAQKERVMLIDRLTSVARTSAMQRLAAFLLHAYDRLRIVQDLEEPRFELPLSQEELADVLGITAVHANRTFAQLDATGLLHRRLRWIHILDVPGLRNLGAVPERRFQCLPDWQVRMRTGSSDEQAAS